MASKYVFLNNFATTLAAGITAAQTAISVTDATGLATPEVDAQPPNAPKETIALTIVSATDPSVLEIVHVTTVTGNDLVIARGREGTTGLVWASGSPVEMRLTAGAMKGVLQGLDTTGRNPDNNKLPNPTALDIQTSRSSAGQAALGNESIAIGSNCTTLAPQAIAIGRGCEATAGESIAIGLLAKSGATAGIVIGQGSQVSVDRPAPVTGRFLKNVSGIGSFKRLPFDHAAHYYGYDYININAGNQIGPDDDQVTARLATREATLVSPPFQFGDAGWAASTAMDYGDCIRVLNKTIMAEPDFISGQTFPSPGYFTVGAGTTGATEPTWPAMYDYVLENGTLWWHCIADTAEHIFTLPNYSRFTPTSIGIIATKCTPGGSAVYPTISAGPVASPTAWLGTSTANLITADNSNHFFSPIATGGAKSFKVSIDSWGTDLDCVGHIVVRGYVIESLTA